MTESKVISVLSWAVSIPIWIIGELAGGLCQILKGPVTLIVVAMFICIGLSIRVWPPKREAK